MAASSFNVLELCAGVGGLGLGIHIAVPSARSIAYVEREAHAAATLVARMATNDLAEAAVWSDLATFDARPWRGIVDCVASGDPCQPNSVAGKRTGAADDRFLIDQVLRVVDECRPFRLFRENVTGNADGQLAAIVGPLEAMGYRVAAGIFSAAEVGASHRRERLFVMADAGHGQLPKPGRRSQGRNGSGSASSAVGYAESERRGEGRPEHGLFCGRDSAARAGSPMADPDCGRRPYNEHWLGSGSEASCGEGREQADGVAGRCSKMDLLLAPGPSDARWPAILSAAPSVEPAICRMADGLAHRVDRLRECGNGVVSVAAARAWLALDALHASARAAAGPAFMTGQAA